MPETTPDHGAPSGGIRAAFQVGHATPVRMDDAWGDGWRCDHMVLTPAADPVRATWAGQLMDRIHPVGVALPRPLRSTDGRYSVAGWTARSFHSGHRAPRFDEVAAAALSVNKALEDEPCPAFLDTSIPGGISAADLAFLEDADLFVAAETAAWADDPTELLGPVMDLSAVPRADVAAAMAKAAALIPLRSPVDSPEQLVHGDMLGCTIFDGVADPMVVDMVPTWHPAGWSVALLAVDAVAWAGADDALLDRWSHLPDFNQLVLRAVIYRLFIHAVLPDSVVASWPGLERVSDIAAVRITGRSGRNDIISDRDISEPSQGEDRTPKVEGGNGQPSGEPSGEDSGDGGEGSDSSGELTDQN